jgi:hypothetical protein
MSAVPVLRSRPTVTRCTQWTRTSCLRRVGFDPASLGLARFKTTAGGGWRSIKDYVGSIKQNQTAIY